MVIIRIILVVIFLQLQGFSVIATDRHLIFEKIELRDGLSNNQIQSIIKDSEGILWFATNDGLNRYDGIKVTPFKNEPKNPESLTSANIYALIEDLDSTLWIGADNGKIDTYDRKKGTFQHVLANQHQPEAKTKQLRSMAFDKDRLLWIGMYENGLTRFDPQTNKYEKYNCDTNSTNHINNNNVVFVLPDGDNIWLATMGGGLNMYNKKTQLFNAFTHSSSNNSISSDIVFTVFKDSKARIWIGTEMGLNLYNVTNRNFTNYYHQNDNPNSLCDNRITSITEDKFGRLWIATKNGLSLITNPGTKNELFENFHHNVSDKTSLSVNELSYVYVDNDNILWIGTKDGGVNKLTLESNNFIRINHKEQNNNSPSNSLVRALLEDKDGNLWIGGDGESIDLLRVGANDFEHYNLSLKEKSGIYQNQILSIQQDNTGDLWFGVWDGGLARLKYKDILSPGSRFIRYMNNANDKESLISNIVQDVFEDKDGRMWIGTESGLCLYDRETDKFINLNQSQNQPNPISDLRIQSRAIFQDSEGTIWVGTWNGLNKMLENNTQEVKVIDGISVPENSIGFKQYLHSEKNKNSISNNKVVSIMEDSNKNIWIGTYGGGVNRLDRKTNTIKRFTELDGLASNMVYRILEDNSQNLWMSTSNGLSRFSLATERFKNYYDVDGIKSNYFSWGAGIKRKNGELVFGGVNGLTLFNPNNLKNNETVPPIYISDFKINGISATFGSPNSLLSVPIWRTKEITLPYSKNLITIDFVAINNIHPQKINYAYKLEGFNNSWIEVGNQTSTTYTNLSSGEYTFKVRGCNDDGICTENGSLLRIVITSPFYATWWFRFIIGLVLISTLLWALHKQLQLIRKQRNTQKQLVDERTMELHQTNSRLLTSNKNLREANSLLKSKNEAVLEKRELVTFQYEEIKKKNRELEVHHSHLSELVVERTKELEAAKKKAEEANYIKAAFLTNMSHEIRTPLNAIVGFSSLLTIGSNTPAEIQYFCDLISNSSDSLLLLIDDILELSILEAKQSKRVNKPFDANIFMHQFHKHWHNSTNSEQRPIKLEYNIINPSLFLNTDEEKVRHILGNLMNNACKYTKKGSITIGLEHLGPSFVFSIKDSGLGMTKEEIEAVFRLNEKKDNSNLINYKRRGLGITISLRLAEILEGRLWAESKPDVGTSVYFSLPHDVAY